MYNWTYIQVWSEKKYTKTWHKWFAQTRQKTLSCYRYKYTELPREQRKQNNTAFVSVSRYIIRCWVIWQWGVFWLKWDNNVWVCKGIRQTKLEKKIHFLLVNSEQGWILSRKLSSVYEMYRKIENMFSNCLIVHK